MLILASDESTEIYYYHLTDSFLEAKGRRNYDSFDEASWVQLYAAPLILGFYAICERSGEPKWDNPAEGIIFYRKSSDLVLLILQLEPDELSIQMLLELLDTVVSLISGPLSSFSLSTKSAQGPYLRSRIKATMDSLLEDSSFAPILLPERVFLSTQVHNSSNLALNKALSGLSETAAAIVCHAKVGRYSYPRALFLFFYRLQLNVMLNRLTAYFSFEVGNLYLIPECEDLDDENREFCDFMTVVRSSRIRGIVHPAAIRLLGQIVSGQIVEEPLTVFIPLTSGRTKLMLLQSTALLDDIHLFTLTPLEDTNSSILNDLYTWETLMLHLSLHASLSDLQMDEIRNLYEKLKIRLQKNYQEMIHKIWKSRINNTLDFLSSDDHTRAEKKSKFNAQYSAFAKISEALLSLVSRSVESIKEINPKIQIFERASNSSFSSRSRSSSLSSISSLFDGKKQKSENLNTQKLTASISKILSPISSFINVKCSNTLPLSGIGSRALGVIVHWKFSGEIIYARPVEERHSKFLKRMFWGQTTDCIRAIESELFFFRITSNGKTIFGIITGTEVKDVSEYITGQILWSLKDILS